MLSCCSDLYSTEFRLSWSRHFTLATMTCLTGKSVSQMTTNMLHLSLALLGHFLFYSCNSIFNFMCLFCRSLFVLLYFFFLAIVLSVLLRYTDPDYPFGISKLFLWLITGSVIMVARHVSLVEQELLTIPEHMSSTPCSLDLSFSV
jgi:hypothetical protein